MLRPDPFSTFLLVRGQLIADEQFHHRSSRSPPFEIIIQLKCVKNRLLSHSPVVMAHVEVAMKRYRVSTISLGLYFCLFLKNTSYDKLNYSF